MRSHHGMAPKPLQIDTIRSHHHLFLRRHHHTTTPFDSCMEAKPSRDFSAIDSTSGLLALLDLKEPQRHQHTSYDRQFIQATLEAGCRTCPKCQQVLSHTNLMPNNVVREMIAEWCKIHEVELPSSEQNIVAETTDAIPLLIESLIKGNMATKSNAAAAFFSLSALDSNKILIGDSGAFKMQ